MTPEPLLPTLCPLLDVTVLGQPVTLRIQHRFQLQLHVHGDIHVGRTTYAVRYTAPLTAETETYREEDPESRAAAHAVEGALVMVGGEEPLWDTHIGHRRRVRDALRQLLGDLAADPRWAAATKALLSFHEVAESYTALGDGMRRALRSPPSDHAGSLARQGPGPDPARLRLAAAGATFPGDALVLAFSLLDDPGLGVEDIRASVEAVHPALTSPCPHDTASPSARLAALTGCVPCAASLGGLPTAVAPGSSRQRLDDPLRRRPDVHPRLDPLAAPARLSARCPAFAPQGRIGCRFCGYRLPRVEDTRPVERDRGV